MSVTVDALTPFTEEDINEFHQDELLLAILSLNTDQLTVFLEEEILDNPFIEMVFPIERRTPAAINAESNSEPIGFDLQLSSMPQSLPAFLYDQIHLYRHTDIRDAMEELVEFIDERGYLPYTYQELAEKIHRPEMVTLDAMTLLKQLEPSGVGAQDLRECLMLQTEQDLKAPNVAYYLLEEYFDLLTEGNYEQVAQLAQVSLEDVMQTVAYIKVLRVNPASLFDRLQAENLLPDLTIKTVEDKLVSHYNKQYYTKIIFNESYYEEMQATGEQEVLDYIAPHKVGYELLLNALKARQMILLKVVAALAKRQYKYFTHQNTLLEPVLIRDVAQETGLSEALIHLVLLNKAVEFDTVVSPITDYIVAANKAVHTTKSVGDVKEMIHHLIHHEADMPTDIRIVELLQERGIELSVREVKLYREALGH